MSLIVERSAARRGCCGGSFDRFGLASEARPTAAVGFAALNPPYDIGSRYSGLSGEKRGLRFSRCEARPSRTSGLENPKNSSANDVSNVGPAARSQLLSAYLVQRMALGAPSARRGPVSPAVASRSA